jgi:hypothetical protein
MTLSTISSADDAAIRTELLAAYDAACETGATVAEWSDLSEALLILAERVAFGRGAILNRALDCSASAAIGALS